MLVKSWAVGLLDTNCYLVACKKSSEAIVIDPGFAKDESRKILKEISKRGLKVKYIVNTHGHGDHIGGNDTLRKATGAEILIHQNDASMLTACSPPADRLLDDGDIVKAGSLRLEVIHTPGHTGGSVSLYCESGGAVFTGDTLFAGSIGKTGSDAAFKAIMQSLRGRLMKLPDQTVAYPGHGEKTTIRTERTENPFVST
ncbi:MAG: MBL fold metallo-hydrolase [Candidatus Bathyarchaeota archaeon]|nr:MBL fold metallo-hydrolase [Candidatus Bathyarchaeota archaeon]